MLSIGHKHIIFDGCEISTYGSVLQDCGSDIELFKALAAMNDENDYMQYFVFAAQDQRPDEFFLCANQKCPKWVLPTCLSLGLSPRKATAEEIVEHFKNRKR